ncbi:MAG: hypothetical protein GF329_15055 [Candidatus Lokiarchaeota archaeon]|nr:hypothetical protein [Candidatus Lokiarchaeota archaeon]
MNQNQKKILPVKGIIIAKDSGVPLVSHILDSEIDKNLISGFVSALSFFGKKNLGQIEEIMIKGLNLDLLIVNKYELIIIMIISPRIDKADAREEAEKALENFYKMFKDKLDGKPKPTSEFIQFEKVLKNQIREYEEKIKSEKGYSRLLLDVFKI